jgi:hypothetical protein
MAGSTQPPQKLAALCKCLVYNILKWWWGLISAHIHINVFDPASNLRHAVLHSSRPGRETTRPPHFNALDTNSTLLTLVTANRNLNCGSF